MATEYLFSNNATTTLAQSVSATATVLNVAEGTGNLFPSPSSGQAFAVTLVDSATGLTNEICYCTSRSGDQLTVVRGREGTNAIAWSAGDTCANYITADVMESWLQESDLNGYATQTWADGRYIQKVSGPNDYTPIQGGVNKTTGNMWFSYTDSSGNVKYAFSQPAGDYATNPALQSVNTNLQNQINNRVQKTGDTMSGHLWNTDWISAGTNGGWNGARTNTGDYGWTNGIEVGNPTNNGAYRASMQVTDVLNDGGANTAGINFAGYDAGNKVYQWYLAWNGNIQTPKGLVAFESDISNLQNQINGKQPAGNYVSASQYSDDFSTSDSRVINLAYGHRIQAFKTGNVTNGDVVTFPTSFSSVPSAIICQGSRGDWDVWAADGTWTPTGFTIAGAAQNGGYQPLTVIAIGPK